MKRVHSFVVSLAADLRPLISGLNRELECLGAAPVRKDEVPEVDTMLHKTLEAEGTLPSRCSRCQGFLAIDMTGGEHTCLNCGRPAGPSRELQGVIKLIARQLIEFRLQRDAQEAEAAQAAGGGS